MSINAQQFKELIVQPTLEYLNADIPYSEDAVNLLLMTAAHESNLGEYLKQVNGPALGVFQIEPATHEDIDQNYLRYNKNLDARIQAMSEFAYNRTTVEGLVNNLAYATAMARVHYYRDSESIPAEKNFSVRDDYLWALADYAKRKYNTHKGEAKTEDYYKAYLRHYK